MTESRLSIRPGGAGDLDALLALFDEAIEWLVARGQTGQWGGEPMSSRPRGVERARSLASDGGLRIAELDGVVVGALVTGQRPSYVPAVELAEQYINLVLTSRRYAGQQIGSRLIAAAVDEARALGVAMLRVDCWAGAPTLVNWYVAQGFVPTSQFTVNGWTGQVLSLPIRLRA